MSTGIREQVSGISEGVQRVDVQVVTEIATTTPTELRKPRLTLAEVRARLDGQTGKRFWKNLDELAGTDEFQELMQEEFPRQAGAGEWIDPVSRRSFLKVMGASFAMAGLAGCTKQPDEPIYPYIKQPEDLVLGKPMFFATAHPFPTGALPILVKSDAFRPIKIEGNPEHPVVRGKSDAMTQATLLDLYDPDRSREPKFRGETSSFASFQTAFSEAATKSNGGQGIYFLTGQSTSPTLAAQWKQVQAKLPQAKLVLWEPAMPTADGDGVEYKLENADVILSLDADFLSSIAFPGFVPMSRSYAERHRYEEGKPMNRMYVVETTPSVTGFKAEHRLPLKPSQVDAFAAALNGGSTAGLSPEAIHFLQVVQSDLRSANGRAVVIAGPQSSPACHAAARQMNGAIGATGKTVLYGQPIGIFSAANGAGNLKSLVADINAGKVQWLVALDTNPLYTAPIDLDFPTAFAKVPNTVHLGLHRDETGVAATWHINMAHYLEIWSDARAVDGTISIVQPMIEPLYGGHTAHDMMQVVLDPSISGYDAVSATAKTYMTGDFATAWRKSLHDGWVAGTGSTTRPGAPAAANLPVVGAAAAMQRADLRNGEANGGGASNIVPTPTDASAAGAAPSTQEAANPGFVTGQVGHGVEGNEVPGSSTAGYIRPANYTPSAPVDSLEIRFVADTAIYDGRYGNNGWLQELPRQITSMSWDNAMLVSLQTMEHFKINENDAIEVELNDRKLVVPVLMVPGHPDGCVSLSLGFGRNGGEGMRVAQGVGASAYAIRTADQPIAAGGLTLKKTGQMYDICVTKVHNIEHRGKYAQTHDLERPEYDTEGTYSLAGHEAMERSIIRYATLAEAKANPGYAHSGASGTLVNKVGYNPQGEAPEHSESFWPDDWRYDHKDPSTHREQYAWGMAIDLNSCTGCNACVVACYAENNIAVVGREQVKIGRDMQWIRIDTYFEGDLHAPRAHFQPMACQHCESAGCEQVCPVGATVHTPEGLNTMVYNRCVGTRYCSNNCPYKVRRFNFLLYSDYETESLKFMRNPDVTVRSRGVMEKCTYCVQRIAAAKIEADKNNRFVEDGEIVTACQQACPTSAIIFGNINDPKSRIAASKRAERDYQVLADLNYRPRTSYTAGVINPHAELA